MTGNLYALATAVFMALNFNLTRLKAPRDITPGLLFGGLFTLSLALVDEAGSTQADTGQIVAIGLLCVVLLPIGFTMLQLAPRYISATEVSLFMILESIVGPLWVWLVLGEIPSLLTLIGGLVIIMGLALHTVYSRSERRSR